jgi:hypothetical protein
MDVVIGQDARVTRSPGTFVYLFVLGITTWILSSLDEHTTDLLLRKVSTNVVEMSQAAPRVLVLSAFILAGSGLPMLVLEFALIHLPAERWLGTRRWLAIAAAGHIGASTITTIGIWFLLRTGHHGRELVYPVDVGVSYTLAAVAAAVTFRLPRPLRPLWVLGAMWHFGLQHLVGSPTFTDVGHACALGIGFAVTALLLPGAQVRASAGDVALRMPRSGSPLAWWRYVSTVPPRRKTRWAVWIAHGGRAAHLAAGLALVTTAFLGVLAHVSSQAPAPATTVVPATVVSFERTCAAGCPHVVMQYDVGGKTYTSTVATPPRPTPRIGSTRSVELTGNDPDIVRLVNPAEHIDASGFFALATTVAAVLAVGFAALGLRLRRQARITG